MFIQISTPVANAPVNYDLLNSSIHRLSGYDREITGGWLYYMGGTNTVAGQVDVYVSDVNVATLIGASTVAGGLNLIPIDADVPAGSEIRAIVTTATTGSTSIVMTLQIDELDDEMDYEQMGMGL